MMARLLVALWLLTSAQSESDAIFLNLQRAVDRDDRPAVAALMAFPLKVTSGNVRLPVPDEVAFLSHYDALITTPLKAVLSDPALRGRFMTVAITDGKRKVTEIRLPMHPVDFPVIPPSPRRIAFRAGGAATELAGAIHMNEVVPYLFTAAPGQLLTVRVERVRERLVLARIIDRTKNAPLDNRTGEGVRAWSGRLPSAGDYLLEVVRRPGDDAVTLPYTLVVNLR